MMPILQVIADAQGALSVVAPSYDDERAVANHHDPNRYVWELDSVRSDRTDEAGGNPKALLSEMWNLRIHCWGRDKDRSLRMRQALITTLFSCVGGGNLNFLTTTFRGGEAEQLQGWVSIVEVEVELPLYQARFSDQGGEVVDAKLQTIQPITTGWDASAAVEGDGILTQDEP